MKSYYNSRISIPLWFGIWGFLITIMIFSFNLDLSVANIFSFPFRVVLWISILLFVAIICFGTGYKIKGHCLLIKRGKISTIKIHISDISSIERSYDLEASPANALKRLRLKYKDKYVLISPKSEKEFLNHLKSINPKIVIYNLEKTIKF